MDNQGAKFEWINSTVTNPKISQDLAIRAKIRKQAMKKAANTRKAAGNYGKINLRQYPVYENNIVNEVTIEQALPLEDNELLPRGLNLDPENNVTVSRTSDIPEVESTQISLYPINSLSATGYQTSRMRFGFDILELSSLTTFHVGRGSLPTINENKDSLIRQFSSRFQPIQWSFFAFIPSLYGKSTCVTLATDCLMSRVRQILAPENDDQWQVIKISNYVKALKSLQKEIDSPSQRLNPDVLCATEILALYELLDPQGQPAWMRHAAGVSRLIQLRGPQNFKTDFEKSLFMAHVGPMMTEALLNGERCFLEQDAWKGVFRSIINNNGPHLTERSEIVIELLTMKCCIPGNFKDVTDHVCGTTDENTPSLRDLANRIRKLRADLLSWRRKHEDYIDMPKATARPAAYEKSRRVYSTYLVCQIVISRLLASISFRRDQLEADIQILVEIMLNIEEDVISISMNANMLFLAQIIGICHASKATTQEFAEMSEWEREGGLIEKWKFELWCKLFGRKV